MKKDLEIQKQLEKEDKNYWFNLDLYDIQKSAYRELIKTKYRHYYNLLWSQGKTETLQKIKPLSLTELKCQIDSLSKKSNKKYKNYFITITTPPNTDKHKFIDGCKKLFNNAVIDRGYMVYEQRGETEETVGDGLHCHILAIRNDKYSNSKFTNRLLNQLIKLEINAKYKSIKQLLKLANLDHSPFSFQNIKDETVPKKIAYMEGNKNDEKLQKVKMDSVFRKTFDLEKIYKKNI